MLLKYYCVFTQVLSFCSIFECAFEHCCVVFSVRNFCCSLWDFNWLPVLSPKLGLSNMVDDFRSSPPVANSENSNNVTNMCCRGLCFDSWRLLGLWLCETVSTRKYFDFGTFSNVSLNIADLFLLLKYFRCWFWAFFCDLEL